MVNINELIGVFNWALENINAGTFLIALLTFGITFVNFYRNRAAIKIIQFKGSGSSIIEPDFIDFNTPDIYWHDRYRIISDVIITNKSAKPISIIEFVLNDTLKFNSYKPSGKEYVGTTEPLEMTSNGMKITKSSNSRIYRINDYLIRPIIDVPPHTSVRGHIFFHFSDEEAFNLGTNNLKVITSRKVFSTNLKIFDVQKSVLPLPDNIRSARRQNDF